MLSYKYLNNNELKLKMIVKNTLLKQLRFYSKSKFYNFFFFLKIKIDPKNNEITNE